ncbi:MAG: acyl-CoA thioesterase [Thermoguttaceae bacterium]|jgi:acyl-CoA thioester hydrolase
MSEEIQSSSKALITQRIPPIWGMSAKVGKEHIDVWGHTNNVCYVQWMQDVAVGHSEAIGWDSKRYLDRGAIWVVRSHKVDYKRSSCLGNIILAQTWIEEMKRVSCLRRYRFIELPESITNEEVQNLCGFTSSSVFNFPGSTLLATASTTWAFVSTETFKPVKIFPEIVSVFQEVSKDASATPSS